MQYQRNLGTVQRRFLADLKDGATRSSWSGATSSLSWNPLRSSTGGVSSNEYVNLRSKNYEPSATVGSLVQCRFFSSRGRGLTPRSKRTDLFRTGIDRGIGRRYSSVQVAETDRRFPTIAEAQSMPTDWHELDNETLWAHCGTDGDHAANEERLIRHIMAVERLEYHEAVAVLFKVEKTVLGTDTNQHKAFRHLGLLPYKLGLSIAGITAACTVPLIFHKRTVLWFNEHYVTADVPEPKDLETWLEVGSFSWQWMEPLIGQASFLMLCMQFTRNQLMNLGIRPYTGLLIKRRCEIARQSYPQYSDCILNDYAATLSWDLRRRKAEDEDLSERAAMSRRQSSFHQTSPAAKEEKRAMKRSKSFR